ncbi:MAG TPA: ROK family protein [Candidatus Limnocylindrales bacterium]
MTSSGSSRHLGLDLGGTNLKWAVVERAPDGWRRLDAGQVPTIGDQGPAVLVRQLADVARAAVAAWTPVRSIGIGVPGLYDPVGGTTRFLVNVPGDWEGVPVAGPIGEALGLPCFLVNDARAFTLAEMRLGAGRGAASMIALTLGTGVGGGIAIDGRVIQGHDGTAGEIGHQVIDPDGPPCGCGNHGCLEAFARADRIAEGCGTSTVAEAVARAAAGDERARAGLERAGRSLAIGIANMITVLTPDRVVLGGGVAAAGEALFGPLRAELARRVRTTSLAEVELVTAELGIWAGAVGAAVHGAERAAAASAASRAGEVTAAAGALPAAVAQQGRP